MFVVAVDDVDVDDIGIDDVDIDDVDVDNVGDHNQNNDCAHLNQQFLLCCPLKNRIQPQLSLNLLATPVHI